MKAKLLVFTFLGNLIILMQAETTPENNEYVSLSNESFLNHTIKQSKDEQPVIIHTQLKHYDQPTLKEYQECHENLEKCKKVCEGVEHPNRCVRECPVCPLLIKETLVVQGINDTNFLQITTSPINTTNIIRLTNEIRNVIETHQGNITNFNENKVYVHQNVSRVGGKFGLGYNNTEPCCLVIQSSKDCHVKKFSTANRCHQKRYRVCGSKCKSRVMMAKRVTICESPDSYLSNEDYGKENCYETITYVPHQPSKRKSAGSRKTCSFSPFWPFVSCSQNAESIDRLMICKRCMRIPYFYILRRGIPEQCSTCFMAYAYPITEIHTSPWYSDIPLDMENDNIFDDNIDYATGNWRQDKTKCRLSDGTISDKCEVKVNGVSTSDTFELLPDEQDEYLEHDFGFGEKLRKRRHTFTRSKYSHRYR